MIRKIKNSLSFRIKHFFKNYGRKNRLGSTVGKNLVLGEIDALELLEICRNSQNKINVIYDIGGHIGTWTTLAKAIFPASKIECFEPIKSHLEQLSKNLNNLENVAVQKVALGSVAGEFPINLANHSDSSSIMELTSQQQATFGVYANGKEMVQVVTLDQYVAKHKLQLPDLMKLDIQGYELEALKGGKKCMKNSKYIILEVSFLEFYKGQPLFEEIIAFMCNHHFKVLAFGHNTATGVKIDQCDILFERVI